MRELTAAVRQYPAREALRRHLMIALFALDRQADALAVYREGRQFLVDEHGVEPGLVLRTAHDAILRSDLDALGIATRPGIARAGQKPDSVPRPAQLPAVPPDFTGRGRQLAEVTVGLTDAAGSVPVWVMSGQGGVGSSVGAGVRTRRCSRRTSAATATRTFLGVDAAGNLQYFPNNGLAISSSRQLDTGWGSFTHAL